MKSGQQAGSMKPVRLRTELQESRWFVRVLLGFAFLAIAGAVVEWVTPSTPPFTGRLAWLGEGVFALAGPTGLVLLWLMLALALTATARFVWRHTAKAPADRWIW